MVIIGTVSYPTESQKEMIKRFMGYPPLPGYITIKGPYGKGVLGEGNKAITIYECDKSRLADAIEYVYQRLATCIGVPGFTYSIEVCLEAPEGIKIFK